MFHTFFLKNVYDKRTKCIMIICLFLYPLFTVGCDRNADNAVNGLPGILGSFWGQMANED